MQTAGDIIGRLAPLPAPLFGRYRHGGVSDHGRQHSLRCGSRQRQFGHPACGHRRVHRYRNRHAPDHGNRDQAKTDNLPAAPCRDLDIPTANANADALLTTAQTAWETGLTLRQTFRLVSAVLFGKVSGGGTGTEVFRDFGDTRPGSRPRSTPAATARRSLGTRPDGRPQLLQSPVFRSEVPHAALARLQLGGSSSGVTDWWLIAARRRGRR